MIGIVGVGNLGGGMVRGLAAAGCTLLALDPSEHAGGVIDAVPGVQRAGSVAELSGCDAVLVVVDDEAAVRDVVLGGHGLIHVLSAGALVIVVSTIGPDLAVRLDRECRAAGLVYADAPVSGGADAAAAGRLSIMISGEPSGVDRAREILAPLAEQQIDVGTAGGAPLVKLCNQYVLFAGLLAVHESVALGADAGIAESTVIDALRAGTADSWVLRGWGFYDELIADYRRRGVPVASHPWVKDLAHLADHAADRDVDLSMVDIGARLSELLERHASSEARA